MSPFLDVKYAIVCDDIRAEDNGKHIIIGVYNNDLLVEKGAPAIVTPLCFYIAAEVVGTRSEPVEFWLENHAGERTHTIKWEASELQDASVNGNRAQFVWKIFPWQAGVPSSHKLHISHAGRDAVIQEFEVRHRPD